MQLQQCPSILMKQTKSKSISFHEYSQHFIVPTPLNLEPLKTISFFCRKFFLLNELITWASFSFVWCTFNQLCIIRLYIDFDWMRPRRFATLFISLTLKIWVRQKWIGKASRESRKGHNAPHWQFWIQLGVGLSKQVKIVFGHCKWYSIRSKMTQNCVRYLKVVRWPTFNRNIEDGLTLSLHMSTSRQAFLDAPGYAEGDYYH